MVMKSLLAKAGIGAATVDTILENPTLTPGAKLEGKVVVKGGNVAQEIDNIYFYLQSIAEVEGEDHEGRTEVTLLKEQIGERFIIEPGSTKTLPLSLRIPHECPINVLYGERLHNIPLTIRTGLDIKTAIDPGDRDPIWIEPNPAQQFVLDALAHLGLRFKQADLEYGRAGSSTLPCYQELEFYAGPDFSHIKEVEVTFVGREQEMDVIIEADKRRQGFAAFVSGGSFDDIRAFRLAYDSFQTLDITGHIRRILNY